MECRIADTCGARAGRCGWCGWLPTRRVHPAPQLKLTYALCLPAPSHPVPPPLDAFPTLSTLAGGMYRGQAVRPEQRDRVQQVLSDVQQQLRLLEQQIEQRAPGWLHRFHGVLPQGVPSPPVRPAAAGAAAGLAAGGVGSQVCALHRQGAAGFYPCACVFQAAYYVSCSPTFRHTVTSRRLVACVFWVVGRLMVRLSCCLLRRDACWLCPHPVAAHHPRQQVRGGCLLGISKEVD